MIKQMIKNWMYPVGKYKTIDGMINRKGESLQELFDRRDRAIRDRIKAMRPSMPRDDYLAITEDKTANLYRMGIHDGCGAVLERENGKNFKLTLYNLI